MSQKPFMWNRNNPYDYSDPSGYCVPECVAPAVVAGEVVAVGVELEGAPLLGAAALEALGQRTAATMIRAAVGRVNSFTWQQFERLGGWGEKSVSQIRYDTPGGVRRVADYLDAVKGRIGEAKNVLRLSNTRQMKDLVSTALSNGWTLVLRIREDTQISKPLLDALRDFAAKNGKIEVEIIK
jgi:hypothetical protein